MCPHYYEVALCPNCLHRESTTFTLFDDADKFIDMYREDCSHGIRMNYVILTREFKNRVWQTADRRSMSCSNCKELVK